MTNIVLTAGPACKCLCRPYTGSDGKNYWLNIKTNVVYSTDCSKPHPKKAKGCFEIGKAIINQS